MDKELLEDLKNSPFVQLIKDYLNEQIEKMNEISTHKNWEEVLGKQYAVKILKDFIKLLDNKEGKQKINNQYK